MARMTREDVIALMKSSKSVEEWNKNADAVKAEFGGYPDYWYTEIMVLQISNEVFDNIERSKLH